MTTNTPTSSATTQDAAGYDVPIRETVPKTAEFQYRYNHFNFFTLRDGRDVAVPASSAAVLAARDVVVSLIAAGGAAR